MFGDLGEIRKDEVCLMANGTQPLLIDCSLKEVQNEVSIQKKNICL